MKKLSKKQSSDIKILGELESQVMELVWNGVSVAVRDVYSHLKRKRKIAYTTIMTIMDRLYEKRILKRKKVGKTYVYSAVQDKEKFFKAASQRVINDLMSNYGEVAIAQFINTLDAVDPKKIKKLRDKVK